MKNKLKTCKGTFGPHIYSSELKQCPECVRLTRNTRYRKAHPKPEAPPGLKWCKKLLHTYPIEIRGCPECNIEQTREWQKKKRKEAKEWKESGESSKGLKWCKKKLHQYPQELERCPECNKHI